MFCNFFCQKTGRLYRDSEPLEVICPESLFFCKIKPGLILFEYKTQKQAITSYSLQLQSTFTSFSALSPIFSLVLKHLPCSLLSIQYPIPFTIFRPLPCILSFALSLSSSLSQTLCPFPHPLPYFIHCPPILSTNPNLLGCNMGNKAENRGKGREGGKRGLKL